MTELPHLKQQNEQSESSSSDGESSSSDNDGVAMLAETEPDVGSSGESESEIPGTSSVDRGGGDVVVASGAIHHICSLRVVLSGAAGYLFIAVGA